MAPRAPRVCLSCLVALTLTRFAPLCQFLQPIRTINELGLAIVRGDLKRVKEIVHHKGSRGQINEADDDGNTALFNAASRGFEDICACLIENGADLAHQNKTLKTALHFAIAGNHFPVVKLLLDSGADTSNVRVSTIRFWSPNNISKRYCRNLLR